MQVDVSKSRAVNNQRLGNTITSNISHPIPEYNEQNETDETLRTSQSLSKKSEKLQPGEPITEQKNPKNKRNISAMNIIDGTSTSEIIVED